MAIALFANEAVIVWVAPFSDFVFFAVFCVALVTGQHLACEAVKCFFVYLFLHNFFIIANFLCDVKHLLVIIFVESTLLAPILKAFVNTLNFNHLSFCPSLAVDILADCLREELTNHFWLGCAKRESAAADMVVFSQLVIACVFGMTIYLEGNI